MGKEGLLKGEDGMSKHREKSDSHEPVAESGCALVGETVVQRVSALLLLLRSAITAPFLRAKSNNTRTHTHAHTHTYTFHFSSEKTSRSLSRIVKC